MPKREKKAEEGGGGHSVGLWYISFSDMITLLLAFFVMLATFSSYSTEALDKFAGACRYVASYSIFSNRYPERDSALEPPNRPTDFTEAGSEHPDTELTDQLTHQPKQQPFVPEGATFRDRKVICIPSARLFLGESSYLSPDGILMLRMIAGFVKAAPCQVIVGEVRHDRADNADSLARAVAVLRCFTDSGLPAERFGISAVPAGPDTPRDEPTIEIGLLTGAANP